MLGFLPVSFPYSCYHLKRKEEEENFYKQDYHYEDMALLVWQSNYNW